MTDVRDYALVEIEPGVIVGHLADCQLVEFARLLGLPVGTLLGCEYPLPPDIRRGECLDEEAADG